MGAYILQVVVAASVVGGFVSSAIVVVAWRNRDRPAMAALGWLMVAVTAWAFLGAARMTATDPTSVYLFERLVRLTSSSTPALLLVFVLAYTGNEEYLTRRVIATLFALPVGYSLLSVTAPLHGVVSGPEAVQFVTRNSVTVPVVLGDTASAIEAAFAYTVLLVAYGFLFRFLLQSRAVYRRQAAIVTVGTTVPVFANVATIASVTNHPGIDLTPATLGVMGVVLGLGLFRYDFLNVTPLASDVLVAELPDPVFVLDDDDRVLEYNCAAATVFVDETLNGNDIETIAPGLVDSFDGNSVYSRSNEGGTITYFDPHVQAVEDQHGIQRGRLVVLRNVTGQQRRQDRLEALQAATQEFITTNSQDRIAELTVTFADRVLDQEAAAVYIADETESVMRPAAVSQAIEAAFSPEELVVDDPENPLFDAYEDEAVKTVALNEDEYETPFPYMLLVPIGSHGVLTIGSGTTETFPTEDEQFATILARTTQVALTQVDRENELRESRAAIERRNEQVEFFNGILRHTLRNALLVIEGRANHLRDHVNTNRERHLDRIVQWCEDLSELSEEIDAIHDTVTATEAEQLSTVDLTTAVTECVATLTADFEPIDIDIDIESELTVQANDLVEKVIDTVVSNAIYHNDADEPRIEISTEAVGDRVRLRVADNGPGMSDEMKETVFERNVATSQTSHGFGLYFVSVMMNLYGGTVWIEDRDAPDERHNGDGGPHGAVAVLEFQRAETQSTSQSAENEPV